MSDWTRGRFLDARTASNSSGSRYEAPSATASSARFQKLRPRRRLAAAAELWRRCPALLCIRRRHHVDAPGSGPVAHAVRPLSRSVRSQDGGRDRGRQLEMLVHVTRTPMNVSKCSASRTRRPSRLTLSRRPHPACRRGDPRLRDRARGIDGVVIGCTERWSGGRGEVTATTDGTVLEVALSSGRVLSPLRRDLHRCCARSVWPRSAVSRLRGGWPLTRPVSVGRARCRVRRHQSLSSSKKSSGTRWAMLAPGHAEG